MRSTVVLPAPFTFALSWQGAARPLVARAGGPAWAQPTLTLTYAAVLCAEGHYPFSRSDNASPMCYPEGVCGPGFAPDSRQGAAFVDCKRCPSGRFSPAGARSCLSLIHI